MSIRALFTCVRRVPYPTVWNTHRHQHFLTPTLASAPHGARNVQPRFVSTAAPCQFVSATHDSGNSSAVVLDSTCSFGLLAITLFVSGQRHLDISRSCAVRIASSRVDTMWCCGLIIPCGRRSWLPLRGGVKRTCAMWHCVTACCVPFPSV